MNEILNVEIDIDENVTPDSEKASFFRFMLIDSAV